MFLASNPNIEVSDEDRDPGSREQMSGNLRDARALDLSASTSDGGRAEAWQPLGQSSPICCSQRGCAEPQDLNFCDFVRVFAQIKVGMTWRCVARSNDRVSSKVKSQASLHCARTLEV